MFSHGPTAKHRRRGTLRGGVGFVGLVLGGVGFGGVGFGGVGFGGVGFGGLVLGVVGFGGVGFGGVGFGGVGLGEVGFGGLVLRGLLVVTLVGSAVVDVSGGAVSRSPLSGEYPSILTSAHA